MNLVPDHGHSRRARDGDPAAAAVVSIAGCHVRARATPREVGELRRRAAPRCPPLPAAEPRALARAGRRRRTCRRPPPAPVPWRAPLPRRRPRGGRVAHGPKHGPTAPRSVHHRHASRGCPPSQPRDVPSMRRQREPPGRVRVPSTPPDDPVHAFAGPVRRRGRRVRRIGERAPKYGGRGGARVRAPWPQHPRHRRGAQRCPGRRFVAP